MASEKQLNDVLKAKYYAIIEDALRAYGEEVMKVKSAEMAFPVVDDEQNEKTIVVNIKVPKGDRSGEPYDCYGEAESYSMHIREQAEKKAKAEKAKAEKIKRDEEYRAKQKANREKAVSGS